MSVPLYTLIVLVLIHSPISKSKKCGGYLPDNCNDTPKPPPFHCADDYCDEPPTTRYPPWTTWYPPWPAPPIRPPPIRPPIWFPPRPPTTHYPPWTTPTWYPPWPTRTTTRTTTTRPTTPWTTTPWTTTHPPGCPPGGQCEDPPLPPPHCDENCDELRGHSGLDRCKREAGSFTYPNPGVWYQDTEHGKYYFHLGKTVFVQRSDGYYSKWITPEDGTEWTLSDNHLWGWDDSGKWYPLKEGEAEKFSKADTNLKIPLDCVSAECPGQIVFPSNGSWHVQSGNVTYLEDGGDIKYELQTNGLYKKLNGEIRVCPENWSWNLTSGIWIPMGGKNITCEELPSEENKNIQTELDLEEPIKPPKEAFLE